MSLNDELKINNILFNKYNTLGKLCFHAEQLKLLNNIITKVISHKLSNELAGKCRVGNVNKNCLIIETSRPEYLTQLKFSSIDLLSELRKLPQFSHIITIKYKICPEFNFGFNNGRTDQPGLSDLSADLSANLPTKQPSDNSKASLIQALKKITHPELKKAFEKLISTTKI
jgi:hypothetical protein